ncbi:MAG TPA: UbiA family prenyltransferase [Gemmatimonadales bacterium]|nr:UbiA family prenyltransferase [Gemmatimonadales bacterium]
MTEAAVDPLRATVARRIGHRVLGPALPYLLHLRPLEWPIMAAHTTLGWLLAAGITAPDGHAWLGLALWVVALNGGTLAINSAFDRDDGDVAYLKAPPQPPRGLAPVALGLMLAGGVLSWWLPAPYRWLYGVSVLMSIAYSVPPLRFKAVAGVDWLINMVGFGTLTPWAGWAITGRSLDLEHGLLLWGFCPLFAALYPLTQLYQMDEDRARGDRTLVLHLGVTTSLRLALGLTITAFTMFGAAAWLADWGGAGARVGAASLRVLLLLLAGVAWLAVLLPWLTFGRDWPPVAHQRAMYHALGAWALTDAAILMAWLL